MTPRAIPLARSIAALAALLLIVFAVAGLGGWATGSSVSSWYPALRKPAWTPPPWVFGPAWTTLYVMIALAGFSYWRAIGLVAAARRGWLLYGAQLAANLAWSCLFFGLRSPLLGMLDIAVLLVLIALNIRAFGKHSRLAAWLLVPYLVWVAFASTLNAGILLLN